LIILWVYSFGSSTGRVITVSKDRYEEGEGSGTLYIRGHDTTKFDQDDGSPDWEEYTVPVNKSWKYIQVKAVHT